MTTSPFPPSPLPPSPFPPAAAPPAPTPDIGTAPSRVDNGSQPHSLEGIVRIAHERGYSDVHLG
ncbi:type IV pili twitching motility protein PilT, partial [Cyanobium sp. BA20m-14]|nr:type IV pili twitching motility protein PilT [Cyanobium sp. BA20m-14]